MLNNSARFANDRAARLPSGQPEVTVRVVDEEHPLVAAFRGKGPFIHRDEPYCFTGPYDKLISAPAFHGRGRAKRPDKTRKIVRYVA